MKTIRVANEFSRYPAGRFLNDGPFSGERFRREFLTPALQAGDEIELELDGTRGYGSSFLEEAFGGLVRDGFSKADLLSRLKIIVTNQSVKQEIIEYINDASSTTTSVTA